MNKIPFKLNPLLNILIVLLVFASNPIWSKTIAKQKSIVVFNFKNVKASSLSDFSPLV